VNQLPLGYLRKLLNFFSAIGTLYVPALGGNVKGFAAQAMHNPIVVK
jgi:hypothetical protein